MARRDHVLPEPLRAARFAVHLFDDGPATTALTLPRSSSESR